MINTLFVITYLISLQYHIYGGLYDKHALWFQVLCPMNSIWMFHIKFKFHYRLCKCTSIKGKPNGWETLVQGTAYAT